MCLAVILTVQVSNTTVCKELALAIRTFNISPTELKTIVLEGFKRSVSSPATHSAFRSHTSPA